MNSKEFSSSMEEVKNILNKYEFTKQIGNYKKPLLKDYPKYKKSEDFLDLYKSVMEDQEYHFLLFDNSFIRMEFEEKKSILKYIFCPFPYDYISYEEFLKEYEKDIIQEEIEEKNILKKDPEFIYEQLLDEAPLKEPCYLIRYDYSEKEYDSGIHSVSHFHIGCANQIRITSSFLLTPLCFTMFIIKQIYHDSWLSLIKDTNFCMIYKRSKNNCKNIDSSFFNILDRSELFLQ
jgi:hypothetical protein